MNKITFVNNSVPAVNATNLNQMQTNAEDAIATAKNEAQTYAKNYTDGKILSGTSLPSSATNGTIFLLYS